MRPMPRASPGCPDISRRPKTICGAGMETGFTASAEILPGIQDMIDAMAETTPNQHPLFAPFNDFPETMSEADKIRLKALGEAAMQSAVIPAYRDLATFMKEEYAPAARQTAGLGTSETEREYYRAVTRFFTTLDISPDEVHELGLSEVARIRGEMDSVIRETGFTGSFSEFLNFLRTDPQFYAKTREELLMRASYIAKQLGRENAGIFRNAAAPELRRHSCARKR